MASSIRRWSGVLAVCAACFAAAWTGGCGNPENTIRIGCKNYTEQLILGEMFAQLIEAKTDLAVDRRWNLGGTMICHQALVNGSIDGYPEYTGTAYKSILGLGDADGGDGSVLERVREEYLERYGCVWLDPLGFNNTYTLTVRKQDAESNGWETIGGMADDAPGLSAGFTAEFTERADGFPGLREAYGLTFESVRDLDPGLMYQAIANNSVDVICGFSTDGRIPAYNLVTLEDNKGFFPPYEAAPVFRKETLDAHPELRDILGELAGRIGNETMRDLNYQVDENHRSASEVAREYLAGEGLIGES